MVFIPLKWLPWLLAVCGFFWFFTEGDATGLLTGAIGAVWLYFMYKNKTRTGSPAQTAPASAPTYKAPAQMSTNTVNAVNQVHNPVNINPAPSPVNTAYASNAATISDPASCPNCKTPVGEGMSFCTSCGTKVR